MLAGSLTFESATARDAKALAWLMEQGASQPAVAEYGGHANLNPVQQAVLSDAYARLNKRTHNGKHLRLSLNTPAADVDRSASIGTHADKVTPAAPAYKL